MSVRILQGDCREVLATLPDASVHCCVTSPPYWGLRDYGVDGQIGLEQSIDAWVAEMVAVFREVRRVLRDDGTLWLNLGDSYSGGGRGGDSGASTMHTAQAGHSRTGAARNVGVLKPKDLIGQPWRVAFALQADGWWLRQDIIWAKPNPMPESVTDRCTKAHEYVFLLSKSERYYYDFEAMQEPVNGGAHPRRKGGETGVGFGHGYDAVPKPRYKTPVGRRQGPPDNPAENAPQHRLSGNKSHKGVEAYEAGDVRHRTKAGLMGYDGRVRAKNNASMDAALADMPATRNRRSVWTVPSEPFKEAHFATFPSALVEPCIKAGCPEGGTVLDPFGGAGTTGLVADRLQRNALLIELNTDYAAMASRRINGDAPLFAEVTA